MEPKFQQFVGNLDIVALDVGARSGFFDDLRSLAPGIHMIGFEPDIEECDRLNSSKTGMWKSETYLPNAVGSSDGVEKTLYLYRKRGCSSMLRVDPKIAERFSRQGWFELDASLSLSVETLDTLSSQNGFEQADFAKLDIQGMEAEALAGAEGLLEQMVGIRIEVGFQPLYSQQPLYEDIALMLRESGFLTARILETHEWRRAGQLGSRTAKKNQRPGTNCGYGELVHADVLFLRRDDAFSHFDGHLGSMKELHAGLIAGAYGLFDYSHARFESAINTTKLDHWSADRLVRSLIMAQNKQELSTNLNSAGASLRRLAKSAVNLVRLTKEQ